MIEVQQLTRVFQTYKKATRLSGRGRGLFRREFEEVVAAKDISFSIREGEFVGFLGPMGRARHDALRCCRD